MKYGAWISLESAEEAAALLTFGCQPLSGQPFSRQMHADGCEKVVFFFEYTPFTVHLRKRWRGEISSRQEDAPLDDIKRAFGHRAELAEMVSGRKPPPTQHRGLTLATFPVDDIELAAGLMAMGFPLFNYRPLARADSFSGAQAVEFDFERNDKALFLQAAWQDKSFVVRHPAHPFSFIIAAFTNRRNLMAAVRSANPLIVLRQGNWFFHVAKDKENNGKEYRALETLIAGVRAYERRARY